MHTSLRLAVALVLAVPAAPALAGGLDLSLHYGADKYDAVGLKNGVGGLSRSSLLKDSSTHLGATAILSGGLLELGAIAELGRPGKDGSTTTLGLLFGPGLQLGGLRLEGLGELAGHRYGDVLKDAGVVSQSKKEAWLVSVGLRPGLSLRFGPGDLLLIGVWAFARWDVTSQDVQVTVGSASPTTSTYKLGGSQYGAALRFGFSL